MNISDQLIIRTFEEKLMIINLGNGKVTVIDEIGVEFWNALVSKTPKEEFIEAMMAEYDVDRTVIEDDYEKFIEKMKDEKIIW